MTTLATTAPANIESALNAATDTKVLLTEQGALAHLADVFKEQFGDARAIIVADTNTDIIAGQTAAAFLRDGGVALDETFVFDATNLHAEYTHAEALLARLQTTAAIPVAVGSGTVNDLCKLASHLAGRAYMVVGTAASMDGYTSFGASITKDGAKQTFNCPAPRAVIADIDIFARAPAEMTAAGYADLFSKVTAGADWIVADALAIEPINPKAWDIVQSDLAGALADPVGVKNGDPAALTKLVDGLMLGGFAMQYAQSSRPASGAEHYISHYWDMTHHTHKGQGVSHGFQVAIGTTAILAFYEQFLKINIEQLDTARAAAEWPEWTALEKNIREEFAGSGFEERALTESRAKYADKQTVLAQMEIIKTTWPELKMRLQKQTLPVAEAQCRLAAVGAPTEPEHIGVSRALLRETLRKAPFIRNRFTVLDLARRAGVFETCMDGLFAKGARWEI